MASILRGVAPPPKEWLVPKDVLAQISACRDLDQITALLATWSKEQINDDSRYAYPLRIGAAYRAATTGRMFPTGTDQAAREAAREKNAALVRAVGYSLVHMRSCARLYDDNDLIDQSIRDYETHKDKMTGRPRKAEGIDYALDCIKFSKRFRANLVKKMSESEAIEDADKVLPTERAPSVKPVISAAEITQRKDALLATFLTIIRLQSKDEWDESRFLDRWDTPAKLFEEIETAPYSEAESTSYGLIKASLHLRDADLYPASLIMLSIGNDVWASLRETTILRMAGPVVAIRRHRHQPHRLHHPLRNRPAVR
jgi:hypothetical protein